jgi:uncharacterized protein YggE
MRKHVTLLLLFLVSTPLFGQNSVTVTATRSTNVQPDLVQISVDVLTGTDASRDDVLNALQGSIVSATNFSGIRTTISYTTNTNAQVSNLDWNFTVTAPLANFKTTLGQLQSLQQSVAQKKNGMSVSFSIQGTTLSPQAQQSQTCATTDLLSDARAQAQKMASAAGLGLGNVLAMSAATVTQPASGALFSSPASLPVCTMTVKFAVTGF